MSETRIIPHSGSLLIKYRDLKVLAVADLHIGSNYRYKDRYMTLDWSLLTKYIEKELKNLVITYNINYLILLGDLKNNITGINKLDWKIIPNFLTSLSKLCEVFIVPGNHDSRIISLVPEYINLVGSKGMFLGDVLLTHGHTLPKKGVNINKVIMGHVHPIFVKKGSILNGQRLWILMKFNKSSIFPNHDKIIELILMPSFNKYITGGSKRIKNSSSPIIKKILTSGSVKKCLMLSLDGSIIGNEDIIDDIL